MKIKFQGTHSGAEVVDSLSAILKLFEEQYGVTDFSEVKLNLSMVNSEGEEVELIDATTAEVFDVLEVHKTLESADDAMALDLPEENLESGTLH